MTEDIKCKGHLRMQIVRFHFSRYHDFKTFLASSSIKKIASDNLLKILYFSLIRFFHIALVSYKNEENIRNDRLYYTN